MTSAVITAHGTGGSTKLFAAPNWLRPVALAFVAALHAIALLAFMYHAVQAPKAVQSVSVELLAEGDEAPQTNRAASAPETFSRSAERPSREVEATEPPNENNRAKLEITTSPMAVEKKPPENKYSEPLREIEKPSPVFSPGSLDRADKPTADNTNAEDGKSNKNATSSDVDRDTSTGAHHHATTRNASEKEVAPDTTIDTLIPAYQERLRIKGARDFRGIQDNKGTYGTNGISAHLFRKPKPGVATSAALKPENFHNRQATVELHRNAVGVLVGSDGAVDRNALATRSVVGSAPAPAAVPATNPAPPSNNAVAGTAPATNPGPAAPHFGNHAVGAATPAVVARDTGISGTGLARPGSSAGAIGGSPKIVAGVISGNSVHLRRP
jgi:hypothetical protein